MNDTELQNTSIIFDDVELYLPRTTKAIEIARKLLDLVESKIVLQDIQKRVDSVLSSGWGVVPLKKFGAPPRFSSNCDSNCTCQACKEYRYEQHIVRSEGAGAQTHVSPANPVAQGNGITVSPIQSQAPIQDNPPESKIEVLTTKAYNFFIPCFTCEKGKEISYKTIFVYEHPDNQRVRISYLASVFYTTKEKVMQIQFPLIRRDPILQGQSNNVRSALRQYRTYLAEKESDSDSERRKRIIKQAEVNASRWNSSTKMNPKTKALHEIAMNTISKEHK